MIIFVSGKYRAPTKDGIEANIQKARAAAIRLWQAGYTVFCPHMNTAHFDGLCDDSVWLAGDLEIMRRCDGIYMLNNWRGSEGARAELKEAQATNMVIMYEQ